MLMNKSKYNVGDFVHVYGYETPVRIYDVIWFGSTCGYLCYLADEEEILYDEDIIGITD